MHFLNNCMHAPYIVKCKLLDSLTLSFPSFFIRVGDGLTESDLEDSSDEEEASN